MRGIQQTKLDFIQKTRSLWDLYKKTRARKFYYELWKMGSFRFRDTASSTFQRVMENIERGKRALVSLKIRLESCINEQLKTNPPEMIW